jgi:hypothetical protein
MLGQISHYLLHYYIVLICRQAAYLGVDVWEIEIGRTAVMRRCRDNWLNGTQILKIARLNRVERRKALDGVKNGQKVYARGRHSKYSGMWIDFGTGLRLCKDYGVYHLLLPLLKYNMGEGPVVGMSMEGSRVISCSQTSSQTIMDS